MDRQNTASSRTDGFFISPTAVSSASQYLAGLIPGLCLSAAVASTATAVRYTGDNIECEVEGVGKLNVAIGPLA